MLRYLHQLSSLSFYVLGASFFVAYLMLRNNVWPGTSALWLQVADLPFALAAILYGGLSLYFSLAPAKRASGTLALLIGIPLVALFVFLLILNFWI